MKNWPRHPLPGKTQLINHFQFPPPYLIQVNSATGTWSICRDMVLPSAASATVNRWEADDRTLPEKKENLAMVLFLIDSRHGPQKVDLNFWKNVRSGGYP